MTYDPTNDPNANNNDNINNENKNLINNIESKQQIIQDEQKLPNYCIVLDATFNNPLQINDAEMDVLVLLNKKTGFFIDEKDRDNPDFRNLQSHIFKKEVPSSVGPKKIKKMYEDSMLIRVRVQGNPRLLNIVQKYMHVDQSFTLEYFQYNDNQIEKLQYRKEPENFKDFTLDEGFYKYNRHQDIVSTVVTEDAKNHIYTILFYDCPKSVLTFIGYDFYQRRDIFVTYAKSHIPKNFEKPDNIDPKQEIYDKIVLRWKFKVLAAKNSNDISEYVKVSPRKVHVTKVLYQNNVDEEFEYDKKLMEQINSNLKTKDIKDEEDQNDQYYEEHAPSCICDKCSIQ